MLLSSYGRYGHERRANGRICEVHESGSEGNTFWDCGVAGQVVFREGEYLKRKKLHIAVQAVAICSAFMILLFKIFEYVEKSESTVGKLLNGMWGSISIRAVVLGILVLLVHCGIYLYINYRLMMTIKTYYVKERQDVIALNTWEMQ